MLVPQPSLERAPLLRLFGNLAPRVAAFLRCRPSLAQKLIFAPPEAIHAVAAFLHHGSASHLSEAELAEVIDTTDPRKLLLITFPEIPPTFFGALRRSGGCACEPQVYLRAARLSVGPFSSAFLGGDPLLISRLAYFEALTNADPIVTAMHLALPESASIVGDASNVLRLLRAHGVAMLDDITVPISSGRRGALRYLLRHVDNVSAPPLPFIVPAPYVQIGTIGALRRAGQIYKNCVCSNWNGPRYWLDLAKGVDIFIVCDDPKFIACLHRLADDHYIMGEIAGPSNSSIDEAVQSTFVDALRHAGAKIFDEDPARSLTRLLERLGRVSKSAEPECEFGDNYLAA